MAHHRTSKMLFIWLSFFLISSICRGDDSKGLEKARVSVYTLSTGYLWDRPSPKNRKTIKEIKAGTKVDVIDYDPFEKIFKIAVGEEIGYFLSSNLDQTPELIGIRDKANLAAKPELDKIEEEKQTKASIEEKDALIKKQAAERKLAIKNEYRARKEVLKKKYGDRLGSKILRREIWIGMTEEMILDGFGGPQSMTRTLRENHIEEQFFYPGLIVEFDNGVLKAYQESH